MYIYVYLKPPVNPCPQEYDRNLRMIRLWLVWDVVSCAHVAFIYYNIQQDSEQKWNPSLDLANVRNKLKKPHKNLLREGDPRAWACSTCAWVFWALSWDRQRCVKKWNYTILLYYKYTARDEPAVGLQQMDRWSLRNHRLKLETNHLRGICRGIYPTWMEASKQEDVNIHVTGWI